MKAAAIDEEMNRAFEGATEELLAWLQDGNLGHNDQYLIRDDHGRILTVVEFFEMNGVDVERRLVEGQEESVRTDSDPDRTP